MIIYQTEIFWNFEFANFRNKKISEIWNHLIRFLSSEKIKNKLWSLRPSIK